MLQDRVLSLYELCATEAAVAAMKCCQTAGDRKLRRLMATQSTQKRMGGGLRGSPRVQTQTAAIYCLYENNGAMHDRGSDEV